MIHQFADDFAEWFNNYFISGLVSIDWPVGNIVPASDPARHNVCFLVGYTGAGGRTSGYSGFIVTDGVRYAYVVDDKVVRDQIEAYPLNLHCRSMIRKVIREYLDKMEQWPE